MERKELNELGWKYSHMYGDEIYYKKNGFDMTISFHRLTKKIYVNIRQVKQDYIQDYFVGYLSNIEDLKTIEELIAII